MSFLWRVSTVLTGLSLLHVTMPCFIKQMQYFRDFEFIGSYSKFHSPLTIFPNLGLYSISIFWKKAWMNEWMNEHIKRKCVVTEHKLWRHSLGQIWDLPLTLWSWKHYSCHLQKEDKDIYTSKLPWWLKKRGSEPEPLLSLLLLCCFSYMADHKNHWATCY